MFGRCQRSPRFARNQYRATIRPKQCRKLAVAQVPTTNDLEIARSSLPPTRVNTTPTLSPSTQGPASPEGLAIRMPGITGFRSPSSTFADDLTFEALSRFNCPLDRVGDLLDPLHPVDRPERPLARVIVDEGSGLRPIGGKALPQYFRVVIGPCRLAPRLHLRNAVFDPIEQFRLIDPDFHDRVEL